MSNAARRHYAAREGGAPTPADARRETVTQPTTPAPAGAVLAEDFGVARGRSGAVYPDPFADDFDGRECACGAPMHEQDDECRACYRERTLGRVIPPEDPTSPFARQPYDPETMAFGRRTRGPFARLED